MRGPRTSAKISLAIGISILAHLLLGYIFWRLSWHWNRVAATLSESGGVVWFNLNPGGSGTGGEAGLGAPRTSNPASPDSTGAASSQAQAAKPKRPAPQAPPEATAKNKLKLTPTAPAAPPTEAGANTEPPAGRAGPGQGDAPGVNTGTGGGEGEGLGGGKGAGAGEGAGPGGVGAPGTGGSGSGGDISAVLARIRQKIARAKRYPRQARAEGIEGVSGLSFEINPDGSLAYVKLIQSSGYYILDDEALATVRRAAPFPYYAGPIRFSLRFSLKDEL